MNKNFDQLQIGSIIALLNFDTHEIKDVGLIVDYINDVEFFIHWLNENRQAGFYTKHSITQAGKYFAVISI